MKGIVTAVLVLTLYISVICPFAAYMKNKPFMEKMGYVPKGEALKVISADQGSLVAAAVIMKVLLYFGSLVENAGNRVDNYADYPAMSRAIHSAVKVDPYNMDAYYFAQATLVWDARQIQLVNRLLQYGMEYRTWDYYLPFFAGFNYAYFLKDYTDAAKYYRLAGDISGSELAVKLAGRYFYESGQSLMAIAYLSAMEKSARNDAIKKSIHTRLIAIREAYRVEMARNCFVKERGHLPSSVEELIHDGYLSKMPVDPYGGTFYLKPNGDVRSTSKFAYGPEKDEKHKGSNNGN